MARTTCSRALTFSVAVAVPVAVALVPASAVLMKSLTLSFAPADAAVTLTDAVHDPPAGIVPPVKESVALPAVGAHDGGPPQVDTAATVGATTTPAGSWSKNAADVSGTEFGLVSVKVSVDEPPTVIGFGANDLTSVGCWATPQPVKVRLSMRRSAPEFWLFAP